MKLVMAAGRGEFYQNFAQGLLKTAFFQLIDHKTITTTIIYLLLLIIINDNKNLMLHLFCRLPSEILMKILSYLDATSLYFLSHVNKLFSHLTNDDLLWYTLYMSEFGVNQPWWIDNPRPRVIQGRSLTGLWKQKYFKALAGHELNKWRHELRDVNPYTGLPRRTEWVILEPSKVYYFETSVILRWSSDSLPYFNQISNLELHGLRKDMYIAKKPLWQSLMLRLDITDCPRMIGKDRLIKLLFLSPGFIVGVWRGQNVIAFIMVCLHFNRLLERSLFGSPVSDLAPPTGLPIQILMLLKTKYDTVLMGLFSAAQNCCFMTLTLLDCFQKPFWCVCAPIAITRSKRSLSFDYSGEHYLMDYHHPEGRVKMELVWLQEERQFFLIDLTVYVPSDKVNRYFCTNY
uniref:F-box domain-containing protein n=1 Tax=Neogobius melanostomus TaxID=47308 RepID=A0A8C6U6B8_9GOBI